MSLSQIIEVMAVIVEGLVIFVLALALIWALWHGNKVSGMTILHATGDDSRWHINVLEIAKLAASAREFFVIKEVVTGKSFASQPGEIPPAWTRPAYFTVSGELSSGKWQVVGKDVAVHVTSHQEVTMKLEISKFDRFGASFTVLLIGVILEFWGYQLVHWLVGLTVAAQIIK